MTMKLPLPPDLLTPAALTAVPVLTWHYVTALPRTAFVWQRELLCEANGNIALIPGWPTRLQPAAG